MTRGWSWAPSTTCAWGWTRNSPSLIDSKAAACADSQSSPTWNQRWAHIDRFRIENWRRNFTITWLTTAPRATSFSTMKSVKGSLAQGNHRDKQWLFSRCHWWIYQEWTGGCRGEERPPSPWLPRPSPSLRTASCSWSSRPSMADFEHDYICTEDRITHHPPAFPPLLPTNFLEPLSCMVAPMPRILKLGKLWSLYYSFGLRLETGWKKFTSVQNHLKTLVFVWALDWDGPSTRLEIVQLDKNLAATWRVQGRRQGLTLHQRGDLGVSISMERRLFYLYKCQFYVMTQWRGLALL